jgi:hypothetical protein
MSEQQTKRGVGRPSLGKKRMYFTLSKESVAYLQSLPAGERSKYVDEAIKAKGEKKETIMITQEEIDRIGSLSPAEKEQEIAQHVAESGLNGEQADALRSLLHLYYQRPERYARIPDADNVRNFKPHVLPYEEE